MRYSDLEVGDVLMGYEKNSRLWLVVSKDGPDTVWMDLETGYLAPCFTPGLETYNCWILRGGDGV